MTDWKPGDHFRVVENYGKGEVRWRGVVVRLTKTQIVVAHEHTPTLENVDRFRRVDGYQISGSIYGSRKMVRP